MYCRNCGKEIPPAAEICMGCGAKPAAGKSFCPNCGGQTSELAEICVKCGVKLSSTEPKKAPALLPGVISAYKFGWNKLWPNFLMLFLTGLVTALISGGASLFGRTFRFLSILTSFVTIPLGYGLSYCYLRAARDGDVNFEDLFSGFKRYWNSMGAGVLSVLIILGGLILLIVPGIIFGCKLAFVPYLVVDRKLGPIEAIKTSWKMTNGHAMEVFLIVLLGIPIVIAGLICLIVGVVVSSMWISMAMASLYYAVSEEQESGPPRTV